MNRAKDAIDRDDDAFLMSDHNISLYLRMLTLNVDFGPTFLDMTLVQYAIAKRSHKSLRKMLDFQLNELHLEIEDIIIPKISNTRGSLLQLALYFGSKNNFYDTTDIECLKTVIDFSISNGSKFKAGKFDIDMEDINGNTSLCSAIEKQNIDAIRLLIENQADIFHESQKNILYKCPLQLLLQVAPNISFLEIVIDDILKDKKNEILNALKSDDYKDFMLKKNLNIAIEYVKHNST